MKAARSAPKNQHLLLETWKTIMEKQTGSGAMIAADGSIPIGLRTFGVDPRDSLRWFIGYDPKSHAAFTTLVASAMERTSIPLEIIPLQLGTLEGAFTRGRDPLQTTDHAFTRFLVPWLSHYQGWSLFTDDDMLWRCDPAELLNWIDYKYAVMVVKHDYTPKRSQKFLSRIQTNYPRKNWSSVILFNNSRCGWRGLDPDMVNTKDGLFLHQFQWLKEDDIGALPVTFNHLVDEYPYSKGAKLLHFTNGGPWYPDYEGGDYCAEWMHTYHRLMERMTTYG